MILSLLLAATAPGASLASGHHFTCALGDQGSVHCWGANESGQLGDGTRETRTAPVRVLGLSGAKDLACGAEHTCVVTANGEVSCWGHNGLGQSGDPIELFVPTPRKVNGLPPVARVFAGHYTTCALTTDARLFCWGRNMTSQLATPRLEDENGRSTPVEVKELSDVRTAALGEGHVCALTNKGEVLCWGDNGNARAGGKGALIPTPARVNVSGGVALAVTNIATLVVRSDGSLVWWGSWQRDRDFVAAPSPRTADDQHVTSLFTNRFTAYVRRGANDWSFPKSGVAPLLPAVDLSWATELVAGDNHACGRARDGKVRCWGWNREGVGTGTLAAVKEPTEVRLDAAEKTPVTRRPERAEACTVSPSTPAPSPPVPPSCGNGKRDVIGMSGGQCAPCMPGHVCPCAPLTEIQEQCDGDELGGATCASQGFASGALRCTKRCTWDTSGCTPASSVPPGVTVAWPALPAEGRPHRGLALAARGRELGAVWGIAEGCGQAVFARFSAQLTLSSSSPPFGRGVVAHAHLAATPKGWLVALGDRATTWVHEVGANGKPGPERAAFRGRPLFLEAAGPEGPWLLGLSTRDHAYLGGLSVVLLDARGAVLAERVVFGPSAQTGESVESLPPPADQAAAVSVPGGFLVARSQSVPGLERGGVVVARISTSGRVEGKQLVAPRASAPFWLSGKEGPRLGWLRNASPPGQTASFVAEAALLDAQGVKQGEAQVLAELDPSEWFVSGALAPGSVELLVPRLDLSGSTLQSGAMTRLELLEPPRQRMTLVDGKGLGPSRLTAWGEVMIAGWVWSRDGVSRLGLAKVLPASAR